MMQVEEERRILMRNDRVGWDCVCVCLYISMCNTSVRTPFGEHRQIN